MDLRFTGIDSYVADVCNTFVATCHNNGIQYIIGPNTFDKQSFTFCAEPSQTLINEIKQVVNQKGVLVETSGNIITFIKHPLAEQHRSEYNLADLDSPTYGKIENAAIQYLGERHRAKFADLFRGISLPVHIVDVATLWQSHKDHPYWRDLGDTKTQYIGRWGEFPPSPLIVDTLSDEKQYPSGLLIDGFKRLYTLNERHEPLTEVIDIKEAITNVHNQLNEGQVNQMMFPTNKMAQSQGLFGARYTGFTIPSGCPDISEPTLEKRRKATKDTEWCKKPDVKWDGGLNVVSEKPANKVVWNEDQYKSPTRKMIQKQTAFRSSFGKSKSFGGISDYNNGEWKIKKKRYVKEYMQNQVGKLTNELTAHDNTTIIPKGSEIKILDADERLPDIEWNGKIINVDRDKLEMVFKPYVFAEWLDETLHWLTHDKPMISDKLLSEFEHHIDEAIDGEVRIVEPDILFTIVPKINNMAKVHEKPDDTTVAKEK